ncbi:MAG: sigma-70 family RNA polymerase sigma factor [Miltoncostaeaceae bacterium]
MPPVRDLERAFVAIREGDASARERVILGHVPLVRTLVWRHPRGAEPFEDMVQVGMIGLIKAVDRYQSDRGHTFVALAVPTVLGEIRHHLRDRVSIIRLPRDVNEARPLVHAAVDGFRAGHARTPDVAEIAAEAGLRCALVREVLGSAMLTVPFVDEVTGAESAGSAQLPVEDTGFPAAEARADMEAILDVLDARNRVILHLRYVEDLTQSEIADRVGISQMHVSRLLRRSIRLLREASDQGSCPRAEHMSVAEAS